jgi:prefoldin alpha subunit
VKKRLASKDEQEIRKISLELRLLEQTAEALQSRINMLNAVTTDLTYATMALESLEKENENAELLVPIGGTSYIRAKLDTPDKIIVGIGAGVSVEKTRQEAKEVIKKRLEDMEKARTATQQQLSKIVQEISVDRERFETLVANERGEKTSTNV